MWYIAKNEFNFYFKSFIAYLVIGSYLTINTLILWFFDTPYNFLNYEIVDINLFFEISPWLLIILVCSLSMGSFSEEVSSGTIELLITKPLNANEIFEGKFLGITFIFCVCIFMTFFNIVALNSLLTFESELDLSLIFTSYLGLFLIGLIFISISLLCSILFKNQVASFLTAFVLCLFQYFFWDFLASLVTNPWSFKILSNIGIKAHYVGLSHGIIKLDNIVYLIGLIIVIHMFGINQIKKEQFK